ncbi:MAG: hypothetical protein HLUCCA08_17390 [Rhodobacteraceae bacterium HLUCCA08]|nr:MAG: hypothetical protein HLUCCA08_17390 [Rhodobacteraceae bacterium HLUCCA08]
MTTPPEEPQGRKRSHLLGGLRNNFIAGLVVIAPIGLTVWLIWTVVGWVDGFVLPFVPDTYHPETLINWLLGRPRFIGPGIDNPDWINVNIRGLGVVFFLLFTVIVGWIAKGLIGRSFLRWGEQLVGRMPVVRSIYNAVKQIAETVFAQSETSFDRACLIQYPRRGIWAIGFISTATKGELVSRAGAGPMITVFVPTTPNPTSGFLLFFPAEDVVELEMSVEDAAKLVISAGLVYPNNTPASEAPEGGTPLPVATAEHR